MTISFRGETPRSVAAVSATSAEQWSAPLELGAREAAPSDTLAIVPVPVRTSGKDK